MLGVLDRHQALAALVAIGAGAAVGWLLPAAAGVAERAVAPLLALLLYATFLGVPVSRVGAAWRDRRFLGAILILNFVIAPLVAWAGAWAVGQDRALAVGVLLVLLAPCVDYVIVFAGLAGGDRERLLAVTPWLMLGQMVLVPVVLWVTLRGSGGEASQAGESLAAFAAAFVLFIVLPFGAAWATQGGAVRSRVVGRWAHRVSAFMVPLLAGTLFAVAASQMGAVGDRIGALLPVIPVFVGFAAVLTGLGLLVGRAARLDAAGRRSLLFSGVTRNSLVVLPIALALPEPFGLVPLVVVTQTLVELLVMVALVHLVPRLIPDGSVAGERSVRDA